MTNLTSKLWLRIILSPLVFLWGIFLLCAGTFLVFPLGLLVAYSIFGLIATPFVRVLRLSGAKIEEMEPFIDCTESNVLGNFLGATIHVWGAFYVAYLYITTGKIFTGE